MRVRMPLAVGIRCPPVRRLAVVCWWPAAVCVLGYFCDCRTLQHSAPFLLHVLSTLLRGWHVDATDARLGSYIIVIGRTPSLLRYGSWNSLISVVKLWSGPGGNLHRCSQCRGGGCSSPMTCSWDCRLGPTTYASSGLRTARPGMRGCRDRAGWPSWAGSRCMPLPQSISLAGVAGTDPKVDPWHRIRVLPSSARGPYTGLTLVHNVLGCVDCGGQIILKIAAHLLQFERTQAPLVALIAQLLLVLP
mmetsp:Transcript_38194/g.97647  ORF Transcript_38194/g.97647 Transcript_38194/m.97647 type:complete len:247 (-) Transcript_38194:312-1052(-)